MVYQLVMMPVSISTVLDRRMNTVSSGTDFSPHFFKDIIPHCVPECEYVLDYRTFLEVLQAGWDGIRYYRHEYEYS